MAIYTHDEAALLVEIFEEILESNGIIVPSPEDDEKEHDNGAVLYGSVYSDLLDEVESRVIELLERHDSDSQVIPYEFSGTI